MEFSGVVQGITLNYQPHWRRSTTFTRAKATEIYDRAGCRQVQNRGQGVVSYKEWYSKHAKSVGLSPISVLAIAFASTTCSVVM